MSLMEGGGDRGYLPARAEVAKRAETTMVKIDMLM